jgi:adenylosuccinate lyase
VNASTDRSIADVQGGSRRFTDHSVSDAGIRDLYAEKAVWQRYLDVEAALASAEAELGLIPASAAARIAACARVDLLDDARIAIATAEQAHPLTPLLDEFVRAVGPEAGGWVHWGATTHNIVISGRVLVLRDAHTRLRELLDVVLDTLAALAVEFADAPMAGRTHGQHAVPITFGYKVAEWLDPFLRIDARLSRSLEDCVLSQVGGAVGTFAGFGQHGPAVQLAVCERLGTAPMPVPSRAIADGFHAYLGDLALLSAHTARVALDIETLMQTEFAELAEPRSEHDVGSSTMPHKRNPKLCADILDLDEELRGVVANALSASIHAHEADGRAEQVLTRALEEGQTEMGDILSRLAKLLTGLEVDPARMLQNLSITGGQLGAEAVMLALGERIGRDRAHHLVQGAARSVTAERGFAATLEAIPEVTAHLSPERLQSLLDPRTGVAEAPRIARQAAERARAYRRARREPSPPTAT